MLSNARREASSYAATKMSPRSGVRCVPVPVKCNMNIMLPNKACHLFQSGLNISMVPIRIKMITLIGFSIAFVAICHFLFLVMEHKKSV